MSLQVRLGAPAAAAFIASLGLAAAAPVAAQQPRQWTISQMEAEYADPFTCVRWGTVRELADGRLMVADPTEKRLEIIDFRTGSGTPLGRQGGGPGEWGLPLSLSAFAADTTLVYDPANNRLLKVASNGGIADATVPLPTGRGGFSLSGPRAYDAQGRLYYQGSPVHLVPGQPVVASDSAAIIRFDPRTAATDTVAWIRVPRPDVQQRSGGSGTQMIISMAPNPFLPSATWTVAPDGKVAIVTPEPYRVEVVGANGARVTGPAIPYQRIKVTDADKEGSGGGGPQCSFSITRGGSAGGQTSFSTNVRIAAGGGGNGNRPAPRDDWPEFKPPFLGGFGSPPAVTPTGQLWVQRATPANDPVPSYDVFDTQGRLIARASLPRGSRLIGFGRGVVYLSRMDEDDLVYIQRWKLNAP